MGRVLRDTATEPHTSIWFRMRPSALFAYVLGCIAGVVHAQQGQGEIDKALRESGGAAEGHLDGTVELSLFLAIITILVGLSIMFETLEHFLRHWAAPEVQVILQTLYGELTTFGTVGILLFVAESTGVLKSVGTIVFGAKHSAALVERVERVDKILLLLMLCFVATSLVLVWRASRVTHEYDEFERMARSPASTLNAAVSALRGFPEVGAAFAAHVKAVTGTHATLPSESVEDVDEKAGGDTTAKSRAGSGGSLSAETAIKAVAYLSLRHQFLFRLRRQRSPPVTASFDFATYLAYTLGKDMADVVQVQTSAWFVLLAAVYIIAPITLVGSTALDFVVFVAVGCLPLGVLLLLRSHAQHARFLLTDPTMVMEVVRRSTLPFGTSGAAAAESVGDGAGSAPGESVRSRQGQSGTHRQGSTAIQADAESNSPEERSSHDQTVTPRVAPGWPRLYGSNAPYRQDFGSGRRHATMLTRIFTAGSYSALPPTGAHDAVLLFSSDAGANYSFLLTCLSLFNSVYACILIGSISFVLVSLLGLALGLVALLVLLAPSAAFGLLLPGVVADISLVTSVEEMSRPVMIRQAIVARQAALAQSAVKVLACLANSEKMLDASKWTKERRLAKFDKARRVLGPEGTAAAEAEARRMFRAFVSRDKPGETELTIDDLRLLLTSLRVIDQRATPMEIETTVKQVLDAMDLDALDEADTPLRAAAEGAATAAAAGAEADETEPMVKEQTVSEAEFVQWFISVGPGSPITAEDDLQELVDGVMAILDADGDGSVSLLELRGVLGEIDPDIDVEAVLASWDKDHDGKLDRDELLQVFSESLHG